MALPLTIYTDGASRGNPGPGGYGAILMQGKHVKEISQGYRKTTNNRMELMAVIAALQCLKKNNLDITIYSDSSYIVNAIEKRWLQKWLRENFKGRKNADLWRLYYQIAIKHNIKFVWVKGHASNVYNNRCDMLATEAADSKNWLIDQGYEEEIA